MEKPERPADDECCGGGYCPCVWDSYHEKLDQWLREQGKTPLQPFPGSDEEPQYR